MQYDSSLLRGLGALITTPADGVCPPGYNKSCPVGPPGVPNTSPCACLLIQETSAFSETVRATTVTVNHHWGLIAAGAVAAFVIYKIAF